MDFGILTSMEWKPPREKDSLWPGLRIVGNVSGGGDDESPRHATLSMSQSQIVALRSDLDNALNRINDLERKVALLMAEKNTDGEDAA